MFTVWLRHLHDPERPELPRNYPIYLQTVTRQMTYFGVCNQALFELDWMYPTSAYRPNTLQITLAKTPFLPNSVVTLTQAFAHLRENQKCFDAYLCLSIQPNYIWHRTTPDALEVAPYPGSEELKNTNQSEEDLTSLSEFLHAVFTHDFQFPPLDLPQLQRYARLKPATSPSAEQILAEHKRNKAKKKPK